MSINELVGYLGAAIVLLAYISDQAANYSEKTRYYHLAHFLGSGMLVVYAYQSSVWVFLVLNLIWALIAGWKFLLFKSKS